MTAATAPATVRPRSPAMVFAACWLLAGVAAARATASIAVFYALPQVNRHYADAHGDAAAGTTASVLFVLLALCSLVVAFLYLLLAILAGKGMNPARIIAWILAGLTIAVATIGLIINGYGAIPWLQRMSLVLTSVTLAFAATATVLLALPAANRFYRSTRRPRPIPAALYPRPPYNAYPAYPPPPWPPAPRDSGPPSAPPA
jgi:hypothetical protein